MHSTVLPERRESSNAWLLAVLAALLTHALILLAVDRLRIFDAPDTPPRPEPIDFVFATPAPVEPEQEARTDEPTQFSELPEDRADVPPEEPDFLSNVDSRARDRAVAETETEMPRMEGRSEAPHVALAEQSTEPAVPESAGEEGRQPQPSTAEPGGDQAVQEEPPASTPEARLREGKALEELLREQDRTGEQGAADPNLSGRPGSGRENAIRETRGDEARYSLRANGSDFFQEEMANPGGNISLFGDISLNTLNWEFAPWIQRFVRDYHRNWFPPYAYGALGLISGYQLVDLEVAPDGRLVRMEVVEEEGHEALKESTLTTFRAFAPYQPLPSDFPEPTLKLRVKVIYPRLVRDPGPRGR